MQFATYLLSRWNALSKTARIAAIAVTVLLITASTIFTFVTHPARTALFATPLRPEQLSEVEDRLAGWNVSFTPVADNVLIEAGRRNDLLLRLSLAGVPHAHVETTDEALSAVGVLTPQAVIDAQTRTGLAGDLESDLRGIDGVDDARVIIAPEKAAQFADGSSHDATASVRLRLRPGVRLTRAVVNGIRQFVAAGVTGLDPTRVTILDDRGIALGEAEVGDEALQLQTSLQSALDAAFGEGSTIVRVHTDFAAERVSARELHRNDRFTDRRRPLQRVDRNAERGSDLREVYTQGQPGTIKRISAAVFVDAARAIDITKVRDLAAATIGYDERRGDALAIAAVDFRRSLTSHKDPWWLLYGAVVPLIPALVTAIAAVIIAWLAIPVLSSFFAHLLERSAVRTTSKAIAGYTPARVRTALAGEPPHAAAAIISALPAATAAAVLDLYPQHEREAIVRRMQRQHGSLAGDPQEYLRRHA